MIQEAEAHEATAAHANELGALRHGLTSLLLDRQREIDEAKQVNSAHAIGPTEKTATDLVIDQMAKDAEAIKAQGAETAAALS